MSYANAQYGVIEREWFGLTKVMGGECAAGITVSEAESTPIKRWYPKGPIQLLKIGAMVLSTVGKGEIALGLYKNGTRVATIVASTTAAAFTISSKASTTAMSAGDYLSLVASTNVCSTGTVAFFVDYRRSYHTSKWNAAS
jgi:hypothetical protein